MRAFFGTLALLWAIGPAAAQNNYTVAPLRLELSPNSPATALQIVNRGDATATMQVQQRAWVQRDGRDEQDETRDLIVSPAIFTFKPGETQIVRIALRGSPDPQVERAYRIVVSEVPGPHLAAAPEVFSFRIALRMDLPLFVKAVDPGAPAPTFDFDGTGTRLIVRNDGRAHIRFTDFSLQQAGRQIHTVPVLTVLAGSTVGIDLPRASPATGTRVEADSNAGAISTDVVPR